MLNKTPFQSSIDSIRAAVAALAPRKILTSADPDTRDLLDMARDASNEEIKKSNLRAFFRNHKLAVKAGITKAQLGELWRVNSASTMAEKNSVLEAELRERGLTVHGEPAPSPAQVIAPAPAPPAAPVQAVLAQVPAFTPAVTDGPLFISAARYGRLTAQERSDFGLCGGKMLRSQFETLGMKTRAEFIRYGGRLEDDPKPKSSFQPQEQLEVEARARVERSVRTAFRGDGPTMLRADFEKLSGAEQMRFMKNNGSLTD